MNKTGLFLFFCFFNASLCNAQFFTIGLKGGISKILGKPGKFDVISEDSIYTLSVDKQKTSAYFGIYSRLGGDIFFQPELYISSDETILALKNLVSMETKTKEDVIHKLNFPLLLGGRIGKALLLAGPVGHFFINNKTTLDELEDYSTKFDKLKWGWQFGVGVKI
jgi:Outer membrane protein beta-barrel domain